MKQPIDLKDLISKLNRVLDPIIPANDKTWARKDFLFNAERSVSGNALGPYFLVFFLFVDLLKFKNLGQFEKVAWSIPIDYEGKAFLIEYRKMGVGVFVHDKSLDEPVAQIITQKINKAISIAEPYFEEMASKAVAESKINLTNKHHAFYSRYLYFLGLFQESLKITNKQKNRWEPVWLAMAVIESFFSWSEHIFIHLALLTGRITDSQKTIDLINAEWDKKFKAALDISNPTIHAHYNDLVLIKNEIRNFVIHGGIGKQGEAFSFHSNTGAVPVFLPHKKKKRKYVLTDGLEFKPEAAINSLGEFIDFLWKDARSPAYSYLCESALPIIFTYVTDGTYLRAMKTKEEMDSLIRHLEETFDRSTNMDW
jgi:hypothetical protein